MPGDDIADCAITPDAALKVTGFEIIRDVTWQHAMNLSRASRTDLAAYSKFLRFDGIIETQKLAVESYRYRAVSRGRGSAEHHSL